MSVNQSVIQTRQLFLSERLWRRRRSRNKGRPLALFHEDRVEDLFVRLGTMDIRSFWSISVRENIPAAQSIIIVGDRRDVQRRAIELGIRALVVTSGLEVSPEIAAEAAGIPTTRYKVLAFSVSAAVAGLYLIRLGGWPPPVVISVRQRCGSGDRI